jgi:hypothetical protein
MVISKTCIMIGTLRTLLAKNSRPYFVEFHVLAGDVSDFVEWRTCHLLIPEIVRERFQTLFPRDHGFGAALGIVWKIKIFQLALIHSSIDARLHVAGQLTLFLNGSEDGLFTGHQLAKIEKLLFDGTNLDLVEVTGCFLAVASDLWKGSFKSSNPSST